MVEQILSASFEKDKYPYHQHNIDIGGSARIISYALRKSSLTSHTDGTYRGNHSSHNNRHLVKVAGKYST